MNCNQCGGPMYRAVVTVDGEDVMASVCDSCGYVSPCSYKGHKPDFSTMRPASGYGPDEGVIDVTCRVCGTSGSLGVKPEDFMFD